MTVYERNDRIGGLLQYGIPTMKLSKQVVQRRVSLLAAEGITFKTGIDVGKDISAKVDKACFQAFLDFIIVRSYMINLSSVIHRLGIARRVRRNVDMYGRDLAKRFANTRSAPRRDSLCCQFSGTLAEETNGERRSAGYAFNG